jgi:hypothetical protein
VTQGYLLHRPMPAKEIGSVLRRVPEQHQGSHDADQGRTAPARRPARG